MFTGFTAKKKDGLTVLALFNLCPKNKEGAASNVAIQLVIEESPVCFVRSLRKHRTFYPQLVANTRFLVALATSESQFRAP